MKKTSLSAASIIFIVLLTLKLTNLANISWWIVFLPVYLPLIIVVVIFIMTVIMVWWFSKQ
jgi:hypothetical protein